MPRKTRIRRIRALNAVKMREVFRLKKEILLQGGQWKPNNDTIKEEIKVLEPKQIEANIESGDDFKEEGDEYGSEIRCPTPVSEELWVVRKRLCRGCHSDGAFWSLQTTTEGISYGDLLQTYFNIQLCPVSTDELALSAICALCAARLREARAFSAQARTAEERFTRLYQQNRVRVLANEEVIKEEVTIEIKKEDDAGVVSDVGEPETNLNDDIETADVVEPDFKIVNSNLNDDFETADVSEPEPKIVNSNLNGEMCTEKSMLFTLLKNKKTKVRRPNTTRKKSGDCVKGEAGKQDTVNSKSGDHEESTDKLAPKPNKSKTKHVGDKPVTKQLHRVLPTDYEHTKHGGFKCARCGILYNTMHSISHHIKRMHMQHSRNKPDEPFELSPSDFTYIKDSFKCNRCDKKYTTSGLMRQHIRQMHFKQARYTCSECGETFNYVAQITKHKYVEHSIDERIKCNACDWFTYRTKSLLIKHKNEFHMLGEKLSCPDCDFVCFSETSMKRHAIKHSTVKKHHCKYCKKSFLRKTTLDFHERIHTGDKRKVCNVCGQAFVQRASLKYHMDKHHPEVRS